MILSAALVFDWLGRRETDGESETATTIHDAINADD